MRLIVRRTGQPLPGQQVIIIKIKRQKKSEMSDTKTGKQTVLRHTKLGDTSDLHNVTFVTVLVPN